MFCDLWEISSHTFVAFINRDWILRSWIYLLQLPLEIMWMNVFIIYCRIKSRGVFNSLLSLIQVLHCTDNFQMPKSPGSPVPGRRPPTLESFTQGPWTFDTVKVKFTTHLQMLPQTFLQLKMIPSSRTFWPLRMQTPCLISSPFPTFLICSSSKTDWRCVPGGYSTLV